MNVVSSSSAASASFEEMIQIDMEIKDFLSAWPHCDYMSTFLARMISHNRSDSVLYSNLFSSALNELFEVAFRTRHPEGGFACKILRRGDTDRIELSFPCTPEEQHFYESVVTQAKGTEARERYLNSLSGDVAPSRDIVLLELVIDYNATIQLERADAGFVTLVIDLPLEDLAN